MFFNSKQNTTITSVVIADNASRAKHIPNLLLITTTVFLLLLLQTKTLFASDTIESVRTINRLSINEKTERTNNINGVKYEFIEVRDELNDLLANPKKMKEEVAPEEAVVLVEPNLVKPKTVEPVLEKQIIHVKQKPIVKVAKASKPKPIVKKQIVIQTLRVIPTTPSINDNVKNNITIVENKPIYNKHDISGNILNHDTEKWSCVHDTANGLMWEVKSKDDNMRNSNNLYSWLKSDELHNNGVADGGRCQGDSACDTNAYVQAMNKQNFCGHNDWRLPTREQMQTIVYLKNNDEPVKINKDYFPEAVASWYWTASENNNNNDFAWYVLFRNGVSLSDLKERPKHIRLVRDVTPTNYNVASINR